MYTIFEQVGKLVDLVNKVTGKNPQLFSVEPNYALIAHLTWNEDGELEIE